MIQSEQTRYDVAGRRVVLHNQSALDRLINHFGAEVMRSSPSPSSMHSQPFPLREVSSVRECGASMVPIVNWSVDVCHAFQEGVSSIARVKEGKKVQAMS